MKRHILRAAIVLFVFWSSARTFAAERPNIVLILADDMGWDISALGHPFSATPHLDHFVAEGRLFEKFYTASPVCSPTRASLLTGLYPARVGVHNFISNERSNHHRGIVDFLDPDLTTVADICKRAGYRTAHFGKWHLGKGQTLAAPDLDRYGFDEYQAIWNRNNYFWINSTDLIVSEAEQFITECGDQPFYLQLWAFQMHTPILATEHRQAEIDPSRFQIGDFDPLMRDYLERIDDIDQKVQTYYAALKEFDSAVGRFLAFLNERRLAGNTLVVFSSDNGPEDFRLNIAANPGVGSSGEFRGRKGSLFEGGIHLPFIARWPGRIPPGRDRTSLISSIDWQPTVAALVGEPSPPRIDGEDCSAALLGSAIDRNEPLLWDYRWGAVGGEYSTPGFAMRQGEWKFLWSGDQSTPGRLHNIALDPSESVDLTPIAPIVSASMRSTVSAFSAELLESAPSIEQQPSPLGLASGSRAIFTVSALGVPYPQYRWHRNGVPLSDGTEVSGSKTAMLLLEQVSDAAEGSYHCTISNPHGSVSSDTADLIVHTPPQFSSTPSSVIMREGESVTLETRASGDPDLRYQWYRAGIALEDSDVIEGATTPVLRLMNLQSEDTVGSQSGYVCSVGNAFGSDITPPVGVLVLGEGYSADYATWSQFHFGDDTSRSAPDADPDGDRASNFLEFAFATSPIDNTSLPQLDLRQAGDSELRLTLKRWQEAEETGPGTASGNGIDYEIQASMEGRVWFRLISARFEGETSSLDLTTETATYAISLPAENPEKLMIRCVVNAK